MIKPTLVMTIFLRVNRKKFYFHIEDFKTSLAFIKKYRIDDVCTSIPHIRDLLRLNNVIELGKRLL